MYSLEEAARDLAERADEAQQRTVEADLKADLLLPLRRFALENVGIPRSDLREEGTGKAGRFDSLLGSAIIEYKKPGLLDSDAERLRAARQAIDYLEDPSFGATVVILTDGKTWGILRDVEAGPEPGEQSWLDFGEAAPTAAAQRFAWRSNSRGTCERVLSLIATVRSAPVTSASLVSRLGPHRNEAHTLVRALANAIRNRSEDVRAGILFSQWVSLAGVTYGIDSTRTSWPKPAAEVLGNSPLRPILADLSYAEAIFVLHTYVSLATKLVACEALALIKNEQELRPTQWASLDEGAFCERLLNLERGHLTERLGAPDLLAGDLFSWYLHSLVPGSPVASSVRGLVNAMSELAWARVANAGGVAVDLLRDLYQSVVPREMRKALGEFFTPRYLAERVLSQSVELYEHKLGKSVSASTRFLDPACGSGTFLVAALRSGLVRLARIGKSDDPISLAILVNSITGFDINPVSPLMSRVNLLLALGDRASNLPGLRFQVFEADSILLPEERLGQMQFGCDPNLLHVPLEVEDFVLPAFLATMIGLAILRRNIEQAIELKRSVSVFRQRLGIELESIDLSGAQVNEGLDYSQRVFERIQQLDNEGSDGVWARIIEQSFAPRALEPVDIVIGNPPWISWKDLPQAWKSRSEPTWQLWGLFQKRQRGSGIPLSDISTLLAARALATYAPDGLVCLLVPQSTIKADPSGRAFRRCRLEPEASYGVSTDKSRATRTKVLFRPLYVDDFASISPFSPDASNMPIALYIQSSKAPDFPIEQSTWRRAIPRCKISAELSWAEVSDLLAADIEMIGPVDQGDQSSPWVPVAAPGDIALLDPRDPRAMAWGRGFETRGLDGYFFVTIDSPRPAGIDKQAQVTNCPSLGDNTKQELAVTRSVETQFIWPLIKGRDVSRWRVLGSDLNCILLHDPANYEKVLTIEQVMRRSPLLYDYVERWVPKMAQRSMYRGSADPNRPWALSGPFQHLASNKPYVAVRYIASGGSPAAAVVVPTYWPQLDRTTVPLPNNKTNVYFTESEVEAHYLAAWVNSSPAQGALRRFAVSTGITPKALSRLPIPVFNPEDALHVRLAALGRQAAQLIEHEPGRVDNQLLPEIDTLVRTIALSPVAAT